LRLVQAADAVNDGAARDIDDVDRIIAELGDEQPPADDIVGQVIDAPGHVGHVDACFQLEPGVVSRARLLAGRNKAIDAAARRANRMARSVARLPAFRVLRMINAEMGS
jgi:hypothetical protein